MKKDGLFDVTMRACDDAELWELVGIFLLDKISVKYDKNSIGLYLDDGLSVFKNKSGTQPERIKKSLFQESPIYYEDTSNKAGYMDKVVYHALSGSNQENKIKNRQRNVIWFNLPYSESVTTGIGESFLYLIDIDLPKKHTFTKIFNRNKVKVSYSCTSQHKHSPPK